MFYFYTPWKRQKTFGFLTFSGGIEIEYWARMGEVPNITNSLLWVLPPDSLAVDLRKPFDFPLELRLLVGLSPLFLELSKTKK